MISLSPATFSIRGKEFTLDGAWPEGGHVMPGRGHKVANMANHGGVN